MISVNDIHWAAGFLEGEGSFISHGSGVRVNVGQVQKEPLERLKKLFTGSLYPGPKSSNPRAQPHWRWDLYASKAIGLMMTVYPLMSSKRKLQIYNSLKYWRTKVCHPRFKTHCKYGHRLSSSNIYFNRKGYRECKICARRRARKYSKEHHRRRPSISKSQLAFQFKN